MEQRELDMLETLLARAYGDPNPYDTVESFARFNHDDISRLTDEELDKERLKARVRWAFSTKPSPWLIERMARLEDAAMERQRRR